MKKQEISFSYKSAENMVRLLATVLFEKSADFKEYGEWWYEAFNKDGNKGDALFLGFMRELFPNGGTLEPEDISLIMARAVNHLKTDKDCQNVRIAALKKRLRSWVYSKWDNKLIPCGYTQHEKTIEKCLFDFYGDKGSDEVTPEAVERFILSNFEMRSDNTTVEKIAKDSKFLCRQIRLGKRLAAE